MKLDQIIDESDPDVSLRLFHVSCYAANLVHGKFNDI